MIKKWREILHLGTSIWNKAMFDHVPAGLFPLHYNMFKHINQPRMIKNGSDNLEKGMGSFRYVKCFLTTNHSSTDVSRLPQPLDPLPPYGRCIFGPPGCIWQPVRDTFHEFSGWTTKMTMKPPTSFGVKMAICLFKHPFFLPPLTFHIKPNATPRHTKAIKNAFVSCWTGAK